MESNIVGHVAPADNDGQHVEFRYFQSLPIELRDMIWRLNLPGPRVLRLQSKYESQPIELKAKGKSRGPKRTRLVTECVSPANLWICYESRRGALREYRLAFGTKTSPPQTYVNFKIDTIIFDRVAQFFPNVYSTPRPKQLILREEFNQLRHLALQESFAWTGSVLSSQHFPNLQSIELIASIRASNEIKNGVYVLEDTSGPVPFVSSGHLFLESWNKTWTEKTVELWKRDGMHRVPHISRKILLRGLGEGPNTNDAASVEELPDWSSM